MIDVQWHNHAEESAMSSAVALDVIMRINEKTNHKDNAFLAFPGGKSPLPIFPHLTKEHLNWDHVTIIPTDDRIVPLSSPLSNASILRTQFEPLGGRIISLLDESLADHKAIGTAANQATADLPWPLDLVWLGMGVDGHTASIFPGPDFDKAMQTQDNFLGILPVPLPPEAPVARVSLSRKAILSARAILITIRGQEKYSVLKNALSQGTSSHLPIGHVLANASNPITVHWSP